MIPEILEKGGEGAILLIFSLSDPQDVRSHASAKPLRNYFSAKFPQS
jgi:hypothetical protein